MRKTLADKANVISRLEHHPEFLLADTESGTMRLQDGSDGLWYEIDLPDTSAGRDTYVLVKSNRLRNASMGFEVYDQEYRRVGGFLVRHPISIRLDEISPVSQAAYEHTSASLRHYEPAWTALANQLGEDPEDVFALAQKGELRSLLTRTDQQVAAPPTVVPTSKEDRMDPDLAQRLLKNRAQRMAADGDPCALNQLQGRSSGVTLEEAERRLKLWEHKIRIDNDAIAALNRQRDVYRQQPDVAAQHRAQQEAIQQEAIYAEALRRRLNQLARDGYEVPDTSCGVKTIHPEFPTGVMTPRQRAWLGS